MYYNAEPSVISSFHHELDLNERILRYLTLLSDGKHPDYIRDAGISTDMSAAPPKASEITESIEDTGEEPLAVDANIDEIIPEEKISEEETVIDEEQPEDSDTEVTEESVIEEVSDEAENQEKEEE